MVRTTEKSLDAIAWFDMDSETWKAGEDSPEQFVFGEEIPTKADEHFPGGERPAGDIARSRSMRKYWNDVARVRRLDDVDNLDDARTMVREYRDWKERLDEGEIDQEEFNNRISALVGY